VKRNINYPATASGVICVCALLSVVLGVFQRDLVDIIAAVPLGLVAISMAILSYRADT